MATSFLSWKRDLDKLRSAAIEQTDEEPVLSETVKALAEEAARKPLTEWMSTVRAAAKKDVDTGLKLPPSCTVYGWHVSLSRVRFHDGRYSWHLSASLFPKGRRADERDWQMLGKIARHLGAPPNPLVMPEDPNDVHHWQWLEITS